MNAYYLFGGLNRTKEVLFNDETIFNVKSLNKINLKGYYYQLGLLFDKDIRVKVDTSNDGFWKKVRNAKVDKVPYFIIIGDKDIEADKVTLESRDDGNLGQLSVDEVIEKFESEK